MTLIALVGAALSAAPAPSSPPVAAVVASPAATPAHRRDAACSCPCCHGSMQPSAPASVPRPAH